MAFIVEDGSGKTDANSYVSEAEADAYNTDHEADGTWSGAVQADKEKALRLATQFVDSQHAGRWIGTRFTQDQALDWPRANAEDLDGYTFDTNEIPQQVKDATIEMAIRQINLAAGTILVPDQTSPGTISSERVRVDTIEEEIRYLGGKEQQPVYAWVEFLLEELVISGGQTFRG